LVAFDLQITNARHPFTDAITVVDFLKLNVFLLNYYLAIQRSVWRDIKFGFFLFVFLFVRLRISQRRMVRSA